LKEFTSDPSNQTAGRASDARGVTVRSVALGSVMVCLVCGLTPYNDYVVANTFMVGSYLPLVMVIATFFLVILVNAPLHRFRHESAFSTRELAVVLAMMLVSCSLPSQGLMRAWLPTLVAPFYLGQGNEMFWKAFLALDLPTWLFPVRDMAGGRLDPVVRDFYGRVADGSPAPYGAWVLPLLGWGVFIGAWVVTMLALAVLTRRQWGIDERLPFPIAQLQLSLIEAPAPGHALNALFRSRAFWASLVTVFVVQSTNPLHSYFPRNIPQIPLFFDLSSILVNEPFVYFNSSVKRATIFFTFIGITYFIQTRTAFSIWSIWLICQVLVVQQRMFQSDIPGPAWRDQHFGACLVYAAGIIWIGRRHWGRVIRHALGKPSEFRAGEAAGYRAATFALVGGVGVMIAWLLFVGVQLWFAALIVGIILLAHLVTARIVAETGLTCVRVVPGVSQIFTQLPTGMMSGRDVFFGGAFSMSAGAFSTRESLMVFAQHGLRVADQSQDHLSGPSSRREGVKFMSAVVWAVVLGMVVAIASSLGSYYHYANTISSRDPTIINPHGAEILPKQELEVPLTRWSEGRFPPTAHDPVRHFSIGVGVASVLQVLTWRYATWPFTPVGYLISAGPFINLIWFSVMLGWLAKVLILRFGGAKLFNEARPLFIGMIFGESLAAAVWMVINLVLAYTGHDYLPVRLLPT